MKKYEDYEEIKRINKVILITEIILIIIFLTLILIDTFIKPIPIFAADDISSIETQEEIQIETQIEKQNVVIENNDISDIIDYMQAIIVLQILSFGAFIGYVAIDRIR